MHRRRVRGPNATDLEEARMAQQLGDGESLERVLERIKRRAEWDKKHPTGEGTTTERKRVVLDGRFQWVDDPCTYQWVRVDDDKGKVKGTFFIRHHDGEVQELFLASVRKGLPPNPYDRSGISQAGWSKVDVEAADEWEAELVRRAGLSKDERELKMGEELERLASVRKFEREQNPEGPEDEEAYADDEERIRRSWSGEVHRDTRPLATDPRAEKGRSGLSESRKVAGQRPTVGIQPDTAFEGDLRFKFKDGERGFRVRGSILGPLLLAFRQAGHQTVQVRLIREAIGYVA